MWAYWNHEFIDLDDAKYADLQPDGRITDAGWAALWSAEDEAFRLCLCAPTLDLLKGALYMHEPPFIEVFRRIAKLESAARLAQKTLEEQP